ncbi:MAG: transposase [Oscillospiraceae bacterium]|nr:transposase [Oscillospiraceae bacterium]
MNKAYKYRLYPNAFQRELFTKTFGCVRFIYNRMLEDKIAYYQAAGKMLTTTPAAYKKEFPWLAEVDSLALCNAQMQLQTAYRNFFRDNSIGFPKFRSKKAQKNSYTTNCINDNIAIIGSCLKLPKAGRVKAKFHRQIPKGYKIKSVTISMEATGKYYASILTEYEAEVPAISLDANKVLGLDYSSPHFYVDSEGYAPDMPHYYRRSESALAREQRKLSKMVKGSSNYQKQKKVVAKLHARIRNQRKDWQHKESRKIADNWDIVCVEDINLKGMAQGLHLAKAINDNGFGQFRTYLAYKLAERGKKLIMIDKWYPSSKLCQNCGVVNTELTLADRNWVCPSCGEKHNRDHNAAINIRDAGLRMIA